MKKLLFITVIALLFTTESTADTEYNEEAMLIQTAQKVIESTVRITGPSLSHGSGFYISPNEIITNFHVIKGGSIRIETYQGKHCSAKLKYQDAKLDLALLTTDCTGIPLELTESHTVGQTVLAVGNPSIYDFVVSKGIVSGQEWGMILFDAPVYPGNSGGPLVSLTGEVIGVVKARDKSLYSIGVAISAKEVNRFLERAR